MSDELSLLLGSGSPTTSEFEPLRPEFDRLVTETEAAGRRRLRVRRRLAVVIAISALAFGGATAAAATPLLHPAIYHPTPAYPLSGTPLRFPVSFTWVSRATGHPVSCTSTVDFSLRGLDDEHLAAAKNIIERYYTTVDVAALQRSSAYRSALDLPDLGEDPLRADGDRLAERHTLAALLITGMTRALDQHLLGLVDAGGSARYRCSDGR